MQLKGRTVHFGLKFTIHHDAEDMAEGIKDRSLVQS